MYKYFVATTVFFCASSGLTKSRITKHINLQLKMYHQPTQLNKLIEFEISSNLVHENSSHAWQNKKWRESALLCH